MVSPVKHPRAPSPVRPEAAVPGRRPNPGRQPEPGRQQDSGWERKKAPCRAFPALVLLASVIALALPAPAAAEHGSTVELELYETVSRTGDGTLRHAGAGRATLKLQQRGNPDVRSNVELSMLLLPTAAGSPDALADISRAYAKFRHRELVATVGKAPFSWGEGTVFNAAQAVFGSGVSTSLEQTEFEENAAWLTGAAWYTGPFSFLELLVLPPVIEDPADPSPERLGETRIGARWTAKPLGIKTELGYLLDGRNGSAATGAFTPAGWYHRPYLSLQGNLGVDWHLSASLEIPEGELSAASIRQGTLLTAGLYSLLPAGYDDSLGFRLETRLRPWARWSAAGGTSPAVPDYGLFAYGELSWDFGGGFSLLARSLFSPADLSARLTPGFSWNLFQGLTLFGFATVQTGERGDVYAWQPRSAPETGRPRSGLSLLAGCTVIY